MFVGKGSFEKSLQPSQSSPHYASARNPGGLNCRSAALPLASLCFDRFLHPAYCRHRRQPGFGTRFAGLLRLALCLHLAQSSHCFATARNPGGSIVAPPRCRSRCSFRSLPPLRFIRRRRRSASEPVSPASSTFASSASGGDPEPQGAARLRSLPGPIPEKLEYFNG